MQTGGGHDIGENVGVGIRELHCVLIIVSVRRHGGIVHIDLGIDSVHGIVVVELPPGGVCEIGEHVGICINDFHCALVIALASWHRTR